MKLFHKHQHCKMDKIVKRTLVALICCFAVCYSHADIYFNSNGGCRYGIRDINDTEAYVYDVPDENNFSRILSAVIHDGRTYRVTGIGAKAFSCKKRLTTITIPNSITTIGDSAFAGCNNLTSLTIPNSVTSIGKYAFCGCYQISSVNIPNSIKSIEERTFSDCSGLTSVTIPNSVTSIGRGAFSSCVGLTSITIPNSVTSIGSWAFSQCMGLTSVTIPNSVTSIGSGAFSHCMGLTSVTIPNSVTSIEDFTFSSCHSLTSVTIPNSVTSIGYEAFRSCLGLTSVTIPNSVTRIGSYAFFGCDGLTSITIPNSVTSIGSSAFCCCRGLASIEIPNSVTSIGSSAFSDCRGLASIEIPNSVTRIGSYAFSGCRGLTSVTIPNSVTIIGDNAFARCSGLTSITIPNSVDSIGSNAFSETTCQISCNDGTKTLIALWASGISPYDISTGKILSMPSLTISTTPTTATIKVSDISSRYTYSVNGVLKTVSQIQSGVVIRNLYGTHYATLEVSLGNTSCLINQSFTTSPLSFDTQQPKVVASGNAIVSAKTNITDNDETNVGFEWRRIDWTDEFASNSAIAYLYNGMIEGTIRNINPDKLWKVRPYYVSSDGVYHYGEWVGLDPTNTSYFEPTIHTYARSEVEGNTAIVKGYALGGSDQVEEQGFKYWEIIPSSSSPKYPQVTEVPAYAKTVTASGQLMTAELQDLQYEVEYRYVAFVTTADGKTYYGEEQRIRIDDPVGIKDAVEESIAEGDVRTYTIDGRLVYAGAEKDMRLTAGLYIIRFADGTTKKVVIR